MLCVSVRQKEHCVYPEPKGQEWDDLGRAGVEGQAQEGAKAEASGNCERNEKDSAKAESGLRPNNVTPTEQGKAGVDELKYNVTFTLKRIHVRCKEVLHSAKQIAYIHLESPNQIQLLTMKR